MNGPTMLTSIDASLLEEAFPSAVRLDAKLAGAEVAHRLTEQQWTDRISVRVENQTLLIPARLRFASPLSNLPKGSEARLMACALLSRSNDGFERQLAAQDLVADLRPWAAPFIVTLIGEYVVEILEDIHAAMTVSTENTLATFVATNPDFWGTIKRRVASYWDVYYRNPRGSETRRIYGRSDYAGFKLIDRLEAAASERRSKSPE
jgi:hypothetical protein